MSDFNKATEIVTFDLGAEQTISKTIEFPEGDADIMFVIQNYDCSFPLKGEIEIVMHDAIGKTVVNHNVKLGELTWPRQARNCVPVGYLDVKGTRPLKFSVSGVKNPVKVTFNIMQVEHPGMSISVWAFYNYRIPMERVLGSKHYY